MKKQLFLAAGLLSCLALFPSCDNEENMLSNSAAANAADIDYDASNAASWGNYMTQVAWLLKTDAATLYDDWAVPYNGRAAYAEIFKKHDNDTYGSALSCLQEIIEGCSDIAGEVGDAKIGDPYNLYGSGKTTEALYAVESWYSWHSIDDYTNNIYSIRNSYYGSLDASVAPHSISALVAGKDTARDAEVRHAIDRAANAIQNIPAPFRNNIDSPQASEAMEACGDLVEVLNGLNAYIQITFKGDEYDAELDAVVAGYVDNVVLPTYASLKEKNSALYDAADAFRKAPSDVAFENACKAWLAAREPWETSEAFLFGPVDAEGLDPNMDSWPLDQNAIVQILSSGNYDDLNWADGDSDDKIEAAQNVRGFHTLEFLIFKDGKPRSVN